MIILQKNTIYGELTLQKTCASIGGDKYRLNHWNQKEIAIMVGDKCHPDEIAAEIMAYAAGQEDCQVAEFEEDFSRRANSAGVILDLTTRELATRRKAAAKLPPSVHFITSGGWVFLDDGETPFLAPDDAGQED